MDNFIVYEISVVRLSDDDLKNAIARVVKELSRAFTNRANDRLAELQSEQNIRRKMRALHGNSTQAFPTTNAYRPKFNR